MKLIQILGLVAVMVASAMAHSAGTNNQSAGTSAPTKNPANQAKQKTTGGTASMQSGKIVLSTQKKNAGAGKAANRKQTKSSPKAGKSISLRPVNKAAQSKTGAQSGTAKQSPFAKGVKKAPATAGRKKVPAGKKAAPAAAAEKKRPAKPAQSKPVVAGKPASPGTTRKTFRAGAGRRDPFVSPIRSSTGIPLRPNCSTGKRCLYIPELLVQGTVRDLNGKMVAVVVNQARHTYFLRESDQVFNGSVQRITTDSVIFREYVTDSLGRESVHEVVKRVGGSVPVS